MMIVMQSAVRHGPDVFGALVVNMSDRCNENVGGLSPWRMRGKRRQQHRERDGYRNEATSLPS